MLFNTTITNAEGKVVATVENGSADGILFCIKGWLEQGLGVQIVPVKEENEDEKVLFLALDIDRG